MSYPNLQQRIETELLAMRPFQSTFQVFKAGKSVVALSTQEPRSQSRYSFQGHFNQIEICSLKACACISKTPW